MWNRMRRWIRTGCVRYTTNYQMTKVNIQLFNHSEIARFKNTAEPKVFTVAVAPADRPYLHIKGFHFANGIAHMPQIHWHIGTKVSHQLFLNVNTCLSCFWHCAHFRTPRRPHLLFPFFTASGGCIRLEGRCDSVSCHWLNWSVVREEVRDKVLMALGRWLFNEITGGLLWDYRVRI